MKIDIRPETEKDFKAIYQINMEAFSGNTEAYLVEKLRKNPHFIPGLSLVAKINTKTVGHILFFPVDIVEGDKKTKTLALAPMSVLREYQKKGVGSKLVKVGLSKAKKLGFSSVIVLGHPAYYPKFGFKPASIWKIKPPFKALDKAFMALELIPGALSNASGTVEYPKEFGA